MLEAREARVCLQVGMFLLEINLMRFRVSYASFDLDFHLLNVTAFASLKDVLPIDEQASAVGWSDLGQARGASFARANVGIVTEVKAGLV